MHFSSRKSSNLIYLCIDPTNNYTIMMNKWGSTKNVNFTTPGQGIKQKYKISIQNKTDKNINRINNSYEIF